MLRKEQGLRLSELCLCVCVFLYVFAQSTVMGLTVLMKYCGSSHFPKTNRT